MVDPRPCSRYGLKRFLTRSRFIVMAYGGMTDRFGGGSFTTPMPAFGRDMPVAGACVPSLDVRANSNFYKYCFSAKLVP